MEPLEDNNKEGYVDASAKYRDLEPDRTPYLQRARDCASLTIPSLFPPSSEGDTSHLPQPWQSLGSSGVKNLAAKLLLTLLPPNETPFKYALDKGEMEQLGMNEKEIGEFETNLTKISNRVGASLESSNLRATVSEVLKQLITGGNTLLYAQDESVHRVYRLDSYVCQRDGTGDLLTAVIKQELMLTDFEGEAYEQLKPFVENEEADPEKVRDHSFEVYTYITLEKGYHHWHQEAYSQVIRGTSSKAKLEETPWIALRWTAESGNDYGRSLVEEHYADLDTYDKLTQAVRRYAGASTKVALLANPSGVTDVDDLNEAEDLEWVEGREDDLSSFSVSNMVNIAPIQEARSELKRDLAKIFLMNTSIQRQGERVTAEEIRYMARELESTYGGIYSTLAQEFQLPLIKRRIAVLEKAKKIPKLPDDVAPPAITTGLEALGRGQEADKLDEFVAELGQLFGPEMVEKYIDPSKFMERKAAALALNAEGILRSQEDVEEIEQQRQANMMAQTATGPLAGAAGQALTNQATQPIQ